MNAELSSKQDVNVFAIISSSVISVDERVKFITGWSSCSKHFFNGQHNSSVLLSNHLKYNCYWFCPQRRRYGQRQCFQNSIRRTRVGCRKQFHKNLFFNLLVRSPAVWLPTCFDGPRLWLALGGCLDRFLKTNKT